MTEEIKRNPYIDRGLVLNQTEYDLISHALTTLATLAEQNNEVQFQNRCVRLIVRIKQIPIAGDGLNKDIAERYGRRIAEAMESGNAALVGRGVADLLAASLRLDADPADKIGVMLSDMVRASSAETGKVLILQWFTDLQGVLAAAIEGWDESGWPTPKETLEWTVELIKAGAENVRDATHHGVTERTFNDASTWPRRERTMVGDCPHCTRRS